MIFKLGAADGGSGPCERSGRGAVGAAIGMSGVDRQFVETGIAWSAVLLGAALLVFQKVHSPIAMGGMGRLHGHARGTEMRTMATPALYAVGLITAIALPHLLGIDAGNWLTKGEKRIVALRVWGAVIADAGPVLLLGTI